MIGRHSKSKALDISSPPINDFSSTTSSSSYSFSNNCSSLDQLRKKSHSYRLASPANQIPSLSDDSLSEKGEQLPKRQRARSAFTSYESKLRSTRFESSSSSSSPPPPPPVPPSVYLIQLKNNRRPTNSYGLTKTITYAWKNNYLKKVEEEDLNHYPRYSVEQVPPIIDQNRYFVPRSSRHVTLQRSKIDYWQNMKALSDSILTSSCQNHTGSASYLLSPILNNTHNENRHSTNSNGHIISITTTKSRQPSLLDQSQNTQWNIENNRGQLRYSNLKWYSADQLQKDNRFMKRQRPKRKQQQISESTVDTGSSSDQHNRSAPPILQHTIAACATNEIEKGMNGDSLLLPICLIINSKKCNVEFQRVRSKNI